GDAYHAKQTFRIEVHTRKLEVTIAGTQLTKALHEHTNAHVADKFHRLKIDHHVASLGLNTFHEAQTQYIHTVFVDVAIQTHYGTTILLVRFDLKHPDPLLPLCLRRSAPSQKALQP